MKFRIGRPAAVPLLILLAILGETCALDFYVAAPSTLRLNSDETIAIAIDGDRGDTVTVTVEDHPGKGKVISKTDVDVAPGKPELFPIRLNVEDFPPGFLTAPGSPKLVSLTVRFQHFQNAHREILIPISSQSGYLFIQTDKPIYTPKQTAFFRIISLTEEARPSNEVFQFQIRNPDNIIVKEETFNDKKKLDKAFATSTYKFPTYPVLGEWSATVRFGHNLEQNSTVHFELQEYVLPIFSVELKTPDVILPNQEIIEVEVTAKHVYGKRVNGFVSFRLGVQYKQGKDRADSEAIFFAVISPKELDKGQYELRIKTDELKNHNKIGWFPGIGGSHLVVEATVVDFATGNKEVATNNKAVFSETPFLISFKRCLSDFKPGLTSVIEADITYVDGKPASGILTKIMAVADNGKQLQIAKNSVKSDDYGRVSFDIQPEIHHKSVKLTLTTADENYEENQATASFDQFAFKSPSEAYIALVRSSSSSSSRLKPGSKFARIVYFKPAGLQNIYYLVVARGKILMMNKLKSGRFEHQRIDFDITHEMVPSFRVIVFVHNKDDLIADSLKIDVERVCHDDAKVTVDLEFNDPEPGNGGTIVIKGTGGTSVGLLGVDEAVYALSKKDLLTKTKVFDRLESHDLGCGPGGGVNTNSVLGNAGVMLGTHKFAPSHSHSCIEIKRRKREVAQEITRNYNEKDKQCCALGLESDKFGRSCEDRVPFLRNLDEIYSNCSEVFLECCRNGMASGVTDLKVMRAGMSRGRIKGDIQIDEPEFLDLDFIDADFERQTTVRSDFKETWIFETVTIGPDNQESRRFSLPHSITTWVVQAVSVSRTAGICVTEPEKLVSFKKLFLHLNLPYSVVRNEQVEIQATVFNYADKKIGAVVYMYGTKGLCSEAQPGEKSERKRLVIDAQSAGTVTFSVVPLKAEDFPIRVVVMSPVGGDVIEKNLHVVPEGVTKEIDIPIKLDPTNQQRRKKRHIEEAFYSDYIDDKQNLQVTAVKLSAPEGFVPGTASCSITALGDIYGSAIETTLSSPEKLLQLPRGCGEQNMMFLAPTLYTMRYLKVSGKLTADSEAKGYDFIRKGYANQLAFRKQDGSYAAYQNKATSTWLTAFVMKVFCQATSLVHIDEKVICSGVQWLIQNQEPDGSYVEKHPMYHVDMMGGVQGKTPMTAFALIALEECKCDEENLLLAKKRAVAYLENHMGDVSQPLPAAIVAYALALSDSDLKVNANDKLLQLARYDEDNNWMYWSTENSAQDIETAGYALLTQLLFNSMGRSNSIVNWLNTKQLQSGVFKSTQDTVMALQALSEYAIRAQMPPINLVANITSSNDRNFHRVLTFHESNALVLQDVKIDKIGGRVFINTAGHGMGSLNVKLRYNVVVPPEEICKFDIKVNVTDAKVEARNAMPDWAGVLNPAGKDMFVGFPPDLIRGVKKRFDEEPPAIDIDPRNRGRLRASDGGIRRRLKRQNQDENSKVKLNIALCVKYLGNKDAGMSIVDVGLFSGFEPDPEDLKKLMKDVKPPLIQKYEQSSRGIVFYLEKVPIAENFCFSFNIIRHYIVGTTQSSVIKVYDYYNPDATCTKFYSPESNSPLVRTICEGSVCECAEGGCPPKKPFAHIANKPTNIRREDLKNIFCEKYDYVWKGKLNGRIEKEGVFLRIPFEVTEVIKAGIEKKDDIEDETRSLLVRDNCPLNLSPGRTYLVLGKDGQAYKNDEDETWYRYMLDQTSYVQLWVDRVRESPDKKLQHDLNFVTRDLNENGCDL